MCMKCIAPLNPTFFAWINKNPVEFCKFFYFRKMLMFEAMNGQYPSNGL